METTLKGTMRAMHIAAGSPFPFSLLAKHGQTFQSEKIGVSHSKLGLSWAQIGQEVNAMSQTNPADLFEI